MKIKYSKEVDILLIELSDEPIAYAEDEEQLILHYSQEDKLIIIEIIDFKKFTSEDIIAQLASAF